MNTIPMVELNTSTSSTSQITQTTCPYCGVGCGVTAKVTETVLGKKSQLRVMFIIHLTMENYVLKAAI